MARRPTAPDPTADADTAGPHTADAPARTVHDVIDETVTAWHADHFHGLGLLLTAELTNVLASAREDLRARLKGAIPPNAHGEA